MISKPQDIGFFPIHSDNFFQEGGKELEIIFFSRDRPDLTRLRSELRELFNKGRGEFVFSEKILAPLS